MNHSEIRVEEIYNGKTQRAGTVVQLIGETVLHGTGIRLVTTK